MQKKPEENAKMSSLKSLLWSLALMWSMKNTININVILDGFRTIPFIGPLIPEWVYGLWIIKFLATISSVIRELFLGFAGRFFLVICLFFASGLFSSVYDAPQGDYFLYFFLICELMGVLLTNAFRVTTEAEYAVFHLRMDAKQYVISRLFGDSVVVFCGYFFFGIPLALLSEVKWYAALCLPLSAVGFKMWATGSRMLLYSLKLKAASQKSTGGSQPSKGKSIKQIPISGNDNVSVLLLVILLFGGGIGGIWLFYHFSGLLAFHLGLILLVILGAVLFFPGILWIRHFPYGLYRTALSAERIKYEAVINRQKERKNGKKKETTRYKEAVAARPEGTSGHTGYRYLNELFLLRHRKLFLSRVIIDVLVTLGLVSALSLLLYREVVHYPHSESVVRFLVSKHPGIFPFVLFAIHSGSQMCHAMYVNCDSAMLIYGFYRKPKALSEMFRIRLLSVIRYNALPALILFIFSTVAILLTGGEEFPLQIFFTFLELGSFLVLFSAGHLSLYYLLQPYGKELSLGSRLYAFLVFLIGTLLFVLMFLPLNALILALAGILLSAFYLWAASKLIRRFGSKTFR